MGVGGHTGRVLGPVYGFDNSREWSFLDIIRCVSVPYRIAGSTYVRHLTSLAIRSLSKGVCTIDVVGLLQHGSDPYIARARWMELEISQFLIPDNICDILAPSLILYASSRFFFSSRHFFSSFFRQGFALPFHAEEMRTPFDAPCISMKTAVLAIFQYADFSPPIQ